MFREVTKYCDTVHLHSTSQSNHYYSLYTYFCRILIKVFLISTEVMLHFLNFPEKCCFCRSILLYATIRGVLRQNKRLCTVWAVELSLGTKSNIRFFLATVLSTLKIFFLVDSNSPSCWTVSNCFWCVIRGILIFQATLRSGPNSSDNTPAYIYLLRNTHKWSVTHRVLKYNRSKSSVSCHKAIVVITGRSHCLDDYI